MASPASAVVTWTVPTATDNSGEAVTLTSDYSPGDVFLLGNTTVTYTATDVYGNTGTYSFNVEVTGKFVCFCDRKGKLSTLSKQIVYTHFCCVELTTPPP